MIRNKGGRPAAAEMLEARRMLSVAMLADLNAVTNSAEVDGTTFSFELTRSGTFTYFRANDGIHGPELWRTDGTAAGTVLVKDIDPTPYSDVDGTALDVGPTNLTDVGGTLYFTEQMPTYGVELYKTDGTAAGTVLVDDTIPGPTSGNPTGLADVGGVLYFTEQAGGTTSLWRSDGTAAGTATDASAADLAAYQQATAATGIVTVGSASYYLGRPAGGGLGLYRVGTGSAGDTLVAGFPAADAADNLVNDDGTLLFEVDPQTEYGSAELYRSDGTSAGTFALVPVASPVLEHVGQIVVAGGLGYFIGNTGAGQTSLWETDGTAAGTQLVAPNTAGPTGGLGSVLELGINSSTGNGGGDMLAAPSGRLFFAADDGKTGLELWSTDGTAAGTAEVRDVNATTASSSPTNFTTFGGRVLFDAGATLSLYTSDGTAAGTSVLKTFTRPATGASQAPGNFTPAGNLLYFTAPDPTKGEGIWQTDGTTAGTVELNTNGIGPLLGTGLAVLGGRVYFIAQASGKASDELYATDGTAAGTVAVAPANQSSYGSVEVPSMVVAGGQLFFQAQSSGSQVVQLYRTDGTAAGTSLVPTPAGASVYNLTAIGSTVYFALSAAGDAGLWRTDGTAGGTVQLSTATPVAGVLGTGSVNADGTLYFVAADAVHGTELWKSDGTAAGTAMVDDINPGTGSGLNNAYELAALGSKVVFYATDGTHGYQPWVTDGTVAGTRMLLGGSAVAFGTAQVTTGDGRAYFLQSSTSGLGELIVSDGTPGGTSVVARLSVGAASAANGGSAVTGNGDLLFAASDVAHGVEPWVYAPGGSATLSGTAGDDTFDVAPDADPRFVDVWVDSETPGVGTPTEELLASDTPTLLITGGAGTDAVSISGTVGVPVAFAGSATDSLAVSAGGTVTLAAAAAGSGVNARTMATLALGAGATLRVATPASPGDRAVLDVGTLSLGTGAELDLGGNDMIVTGGGLSAVTALARSGFAGGSWTGPGLASSAAAADGSHRTALGVVQNVKADGTTPLYTTFDGVAVGASAVLVKYTVYGDVNLDGVVDIADFTLIDAGFIGKRTGWANGDLNYDGTVDGSDFTLADNAFNLQLNSAGVAAAPTTAAAGPTAAPAAQVVTAATARAHRSALPPPPPSLPPPSATPASTDDDRKKGLAAELLDDATSSN
jgi:ELWxxDGT repeat protein